MGEPVAAGWPRRRGRAIRLIVVVGLVALSFVPVSTRVAPQVSIKVVDERGRPAPPMGSATWRGGFYAAFFQDHLSFDADGRLNAPGRRVGVSALRRAAAWVAAMVPHSGGMRTPFAEVSFELPPGYVLDVEDWPAPAFDSGAGQPGGRVRCWDRPGSVWRVCYSQGEDAANRVSVATEKPESGGSELLELGVRRER